MTTPRRAEGTEQISALFHALADASRRDMIARLLVEESSVTSLARHYPMSFAAVQKHVTVLQKAGLVTKRRSGREQLVSAEVTALRRAGSHLTELEMIWRGRVQRMDDLLAE